MRSYSKDNEDDLIEAKKLNAESWQTDLLEMNPRYVHWGNFEDYMSTDKGGWDSRVNLSSWSEKFNLDELNELANFYFEVYRKNHQCEHCEGSGLNAATHQLSEDWYDFAETGRKWCYKLTDVEVLALAKNGRLHNFTDESFHFDDDLQKWAVWKNNEKVFVDEMPKLPSASDVNDKAKNGRGIGHDAINRWVCVDARAKHLGIYGHCEHCEGGYMFDEDKAKVALQMWFLHPRKGCSRGVYIEDIKESEIPEVIAYLKEAKERNNNRFEGLLKYKEKSI